MVRSGVMGVYWLLLPIYVDDDDHYGWLRKLGFFRDLGGLSQQHKWQIKKSPILWWEIFLNLERNKRLELSTPTLAIFTDIKYPELDKLYFNKSYI